MAVFVDLGDEDTEPPLSPPAGPPIATEKDLPGEPSQAPPTETNRNAESSHPAPQARNVVAEAFACYPIAMAVAQSIDLTTLDSLSRTCRRVHDALIQYRRILLVSTLRCYREDVPVNPEDTFRHRARAGNWFVYRGMDMRNYDGKSGHCARDMVAECRRCGVVVCRNCAIKQPEPSALKERHRRLCLSCTKAPLPLLVNPLLDADTPISSEAVQHNLCQCATRGVWLCQPCGRTIRSADHDYLRVWRWRNQYGEVLGGLGTGIGEGDRGVICGREEKCHGAKEREQETDCDAEDAQNSDTLPWGSFNSNASSFGTPEQQLQQQDDVARERQLRPGYARHQVEGIGGKMTNKLLKMVRVGECVRVWEDEKTNQSILAREVEGKSRSWCGWCWRAIPGAKDLKGA